MGESFGLFSHASVPSTSHSIIIFLPSGLKRIEEVLKTHGQVS